MTGFLIKSGNVDTDRYTGRMTCEHENRDSGGVPLSKGIPMTASKPEARGEAWDRFSFIALRGHQTGGHRDFRHLASRTVGKYIFVKLPGFCYLASLGNFYKS